MTRHIITQDDSNAVKAAKVVGGCSALLIGFVGMFILFATLGTIPVYFIWNLVLVKVVGGLTQVTFLQAWAISVFIGLFRSHSTSTKSSD